MKTIKKIIGILLAVMMAAQLTVMFAAAEDDTTGTYNGYSYERLLDYAIIYEYSGEAKGEIVLPEYVDGLKVLGVYGDLFEGCTELESAVFPDSYYNITGNVFGGCTSPYIRRGALRLCPYCQALSFVLHLQKRKIPPSKT